MNFKEILKYEEMNDIQKALYNQYKNKFPKISPHNIEFLVTYGEEYATRYAKMCVSPIPTQMYIFSMHSSVTISDSTIDYDYGAYFTFKEAYEHIEKSIKNFCDRRNYKVRYVCDDENFYEDLNSIENDRYIRYQREVVLDSVFSHRLNYVITRDLLTIHPDEIFVIPDTGKNGVIIVDK